MKKVLITGTEGFIGKNLKKFLEKDYWIFEINEDVFNSDEWKHNTLNLIDYIRPDVIFHIGACSNTLETDVNYMMTRNYEFTKMISDWSSNNKTPLIYSSSAASYGVNNMYPSNLYGWSKYIAEDYVIKNGGVALRYFNVYGDGEENKGDMASVAYQMFNKHKYGEDILLFPLNPTRDFVYINDVISSNIYAYENFLKLGGKYYDVGSGESRSFEDVMNIMGFDFKYKSENEIPDGYQFYTCSDKSKWMKGWEPKYTIDNGLVEYKKYLKNNSLY